jgi:hypothetical protein
MNGVVEYSTQMEMKHLHISELFSQFSDFQQKRLMKSTPEMQTPVKDLLGQLLSRCDQKTEVSTLQKVLLDPYFPLGMLEQTIFADVVGMRFFIKKSRPDLEPVLAGELVDWAAAFLSVKNDIQNLFDPETITCIPLDGTKHLLPPGQWCTLCGVCCQIGGVPPEPPSGIYYPEHWYAYISGRAVENQQLCPFLFQYFGESRFFCAIHTIKPMACRKFDRKDCLRRLADNNLHENHHFS